MKWLMLISGIPELALTGYALILFRNLKNELAVFRWFILLSFITELASVLLWWNHKNNLPLLHVYVALGFVILSAFYKSVLRDFISPRIFGTVLLLFLTFTVINSAFIQQPFTFNSYALTTESILVLILSFFTFLALQNEAVTQGQSERFTSIRWVNSGLFIYYASNLLLFYFGDIINKSFPIYLSQYTWLMSNFFSAIMYTCFFIGLWKRPKM